jgi:hypothetical protein
MKILNIIETNKGIITQVISYVVHEPQLSDEVFEPALADFLDMVKKHDYLLTEEDLEDISDKQIYYDYSGYVLELVWSTEIINE